MSSGIDVHAAMAREAVASMFNDYLRMMRKYRRQAGELQAQNDRLREYLGKLVRCADSSDWDYHWSRGDAKNLLDLIYHELDEPQKGEEEDSDD
jgi:hypothetical protein